MKKLATQSTDLVERCHEILEWKRSGILKGLRLRELAATLTHISRTYRLQVAEEQTKTEAMEAVVNGELTNLEPKP